jgi:hypothetical protein
MAGAVARWWSAGRREAMTAAADGGRQVNVCPYLGVAGDPATHYSYPSAAQRCHAGRQPLDIDQAKQGRDCLTELHVTCSRYHAPLAVSPRRRMLSGEPGVSLEAVHPSSSAGSGVAASAPRRSQSRRVLWLALSAALLIAAVAGGLWLGWHAGPPLASGPPASAALGGGAIASPSAAPPESPSPSPRATASATPSASPSQTPVPTALPTPTASPSPRVATIVHVVRPGDSLIAIAQRYGVSVAALKAINRDRYPSLVTNPNLIFPGQRILVPVR